MKKKGLINFILIYILIALAGLLGVFVICSTYTFHVELSKSSDAMYKSTIDTASIYGDDILGEDITKKNNACEALLNLSVITETNIMVIRQDGNVEFNSAYNLDKNKNSSPLYHIENYDSTKLGGEHVWRGDFYGSFAEKHISVFAPVITDYTTPGYVVLSIPEKTVWNNTFDLVYTYLLLYGIIVGLSFIFVDRYYKKVYRPLKETALIIGHYRDGDYDHELTVHKGSDTAYLEENLLEMFKKLRESDKAQLKFLSNISHDFRSPLTSIKGYLTAIKDGVIPSDQLDKYIDILLFEANRLTGLTENIMTLNELDPKHMHLQKSDFDINEAIKHTIETMEGICSKRNISFDLSFCDNKTYINADRSKFEQIVYNLTDNAIKFSPDNSIIEIMVKKDDKKAIISITDHGDGIHKDNIDKIWDRMFKTDTSRNLNKKSSGLGLSITKDIINAHNEKITVESNNEGTTFTFTATLSKDDSLLFTSRSDDEELLLH